MRQGRAHRTARIAAGVMLVVAGAAIFVARPGIALAHHVTVTDSAACAGWTTKAEYFGGNDDRKIVIDVMINAEHIDQTLYFDAGAGHLGHQDYYLLYARSGSGSLTTSGTIVMYERSGAGQYTVVNDYDVLAEHLVCAAATPTNTATATATSSNTPPPATSTPTATNTAVPTSTPTETTATDTPSPIATSSTQPTASSTPSPTSSTGTPVATTTTTSATSTPAATNTPATPPTTTPVIALGTATPIASQTSQTVETTPTLTSSVLGAVPPDQGHHLPPEAPAPSGRAFPATGDGTSTPNALLFGLLGTIIAATGLGVFSTGLRTRND